MDNQNYFVDLSDTQSNEDEDFLECGICRNIDGELNPCEHVFCETCLRRLNQAIMRMKREMEDERFLESRRQAWQELVATRRDPYEYAKTVFCLVLIVVLGSLLAVGYVIKFLGIDTSNICQFLSF